MEEKDKLKVEKLQNDGANWVSYKAQMLWALRSRKWEDHFTNATVSPAYTAAGDIDNVTPQRR